MWCGPTAAPVPAGQIEAWADEDGVRPFGLYRDERLVGYGELWVDDDEAEVELARLIVDPRERGRGLGRYLVTELAGRAREVHPLVFLRVHPANHSSCGSTRRTTPRSAATPRRASSRWRRSRPRSGTPASPSAISGSRRPRRRVGG
jgi:GNAT superfamily N-acetyltransferase